MRDIAVRISNRPGCAGGAGEALGQANISKPFAVCGAYALLVLQLAGVRWGLESEFTCRRFAGAEADHQWAPDCPSAELCAINN